MTGLPLKMRAALYRRTGPATEVLEFAEMDLPQLQTGEVLVEVAVSGINPHDTKNRAGWRGARDGIAVVPHGDGAGRIVAVGDDVASERIGERVWFSGAGGRPGSTGSAASYAAVVAVEAIRLPDGATYADGGCLGIPAHTAYRALFWDGQVSGQTILVAGGAGVVAGYAVQFAKAAGARVIATVSTAEKAHHAKRLGADHTVDYRASDAVAQVLGIAGEAGVDRIIEVDFGTNIPFNAQILKVGGIIASYSSTRDPNPVLPYYDFGARAATIHFVRDAAIPAPARRAAAGEITTALEEGRLINTIAASFPFADIAAAHEYQETGNHIGKILVNIADMPQL